MNSERIESLLKAITSLKSMLSESNTTSASKECSAQEQVRISPQNETIPTSDKKSTTSIFGSLPDLQLSVIKHVISVLSKDGKEKVAALTNNAEEREAIAYTIVSCFFGVIKDDVSHIQLLSGFKK